MITGDDIDRIKRYMEHAFESSKEMDEFYQLDIDSIASHPDSISNARLSPMEIFRAGLIIGMQIETERSHYGTDH